MTAPAFRFDWSQLAAWNYRQFWNTLRRIPDPVIMSMATQEFDMSDGSKCLCAVAAREGAAWAGRLGWSTPRIGELWNTPGVSVPERCRALFGGEIVEWTRLYAWAGSRHHGDDIELAFAERVAECV